MILCRRTEWEVETRCVRAALDTLVGVWTLLMVQQDVGFTFDPRHLTTLRFVRAGFPLPELLVVETNL